MAYSDARYDHYAVLNPFDEKNAKSYIFKTLKERSHFLKMNKVQVAFCFTTMKGFTEVIVSHYYVRKGSGIEIEGVNV